MQGLTFTESKRQEESYRQPRLIGNESYIVIHNHHPAYLSREEQAEFKAILKGDPKREMKRGRCRSLLHGLVRCVICGESL